MKNFSVSMRFKVLLIVISIVFVSLGAYLFFAIDLFKKDKVSYIYDSSLSNAYSLSQQVEQFVSSSVKFARTMSFLGEVLKESLEKMIDSDNNIVAFTKLSNVNGKVNSVVEIYDDNFLRSIKKKRNDLSFLKNEVYRKSNRQLVIHNVTTELNKPAIVLTFWQKDRKVGYQMMIYLGKIIDIFNKSKVYNNSLISLSDGSAIIGESLSLSSNDIEEIKALQVSEGSRLLEIEGVIYSFSKINSINMVVVSEIKTDKAFIAMKQMIEKSSYLGLFLLSIAVIFGILFSSGLTKKLRILHQGALKIGQGDFSPVEITANDEIGDLSKTFNLMIKELSASFKKIEDYSKNLEKMVEQRTKQLAEAYSNLDAMVNSLGQGLLLFSPSRICSDIYTKACEGIFGITPKDERVEKVLGLDEKEEKTFQNWSRLAFEEKLPFDDIKKLGPSVIRPIEDFEDENFKNISIEYFPIRSEDKKIEQLVLVATDNTREFIAEKRFEEKEAYVSRVIKLINYKDQFFSFVQDFKDLTSKIGMIGQCEMTEDSLSLAKMYLHSLKGNSGLFSINEAYSKVHGYENQLAKMSLDNGREIQDLLEVASGELTKIIDNFVNENIKLLGAEFKDGKKRFEIKEEALYEFISKYSLDPKAKESFVYDFCSEPLDNYFKGYNLLIEDVAANLNKKVAPIKFKNANLKVETKKFREFFNVLVHVFRNNIDHGIEMPGDRVALGKEETGSIWVEFDKSDSNLEILIKDDGGGIRVDKIREKIGESANSLSDQDVMMKIFDDDMSTSEIVTEISGRGVGMSAVKSIVDELGGSIQVQSKVGEGTEFKFQLPL